MQQNCFYKDGLNFSCKQCSNCCGHTPGFVYLSLRDLNELCKFKNMIHTDFIQNYCRWVNYYEGKTVLALKELKNYNCILWDNGCSCYSARPVQCSTYPFWTWMIENKDCWDDVAKDCPGMNNGQLHCVEEIERESKKYSENIPLEKEQFEMLWQQINS